jgi:hypothetical protein
MPGVLLRTEFLSTFVFVCGQFCSELSVVGRNRAEPCCQQKVRNTRAATEPTWLAMGARVGGSCWQWKRAAWQMERTVGRGVFEWCKTRGKLSPPRITVVVITQGHAAHPNCRLAGSTFLVCRVLSVGLVTADFGRGHHKNAEEPPPIISAICLLTFHVRRHKSALF